MKQYSQKYNGTEMVVMDTEDGLESEHLGAIQHAETQDEFSAWEESEHFACNFDGETYVKMRDEDGFYTAHTQTEANEILGESE